VVDDGEQLALLHTGAGLDVEFDDLAGRLRLDVDGSHRLDDAGGGCGHHNGAPFDRDLLVERRGLLALAGEHCHGQHAHRKYR
jgi:hypothetical protein